VFGLAPNGMGTMAFGAKVKTGDKLRNLSVDSVISVRDIKNLCDLCASNEPALLPSPLGICLRLSRWQSEADGRSEWVVNKG
jgi:hypothetical protein